MSRVSGTLRLPGLGLSDSFLLPLIFLSRQHHSLSLQISILQPVGNMVIDVSLVLYLTDSTNPLSACALTYQEDIHWLNLGQALVLASEMLSKR